MPPPCVHCGQPTTHLPGCPELAYNVEIARRAAEMLAQTMAQRRSGPETYMTASSEPRQETRIADIRIEDMKRILDSPDHGIVLPSAQWSRVNNPDSWNPMDAAPVNMAKHVVTSRPDIPYLSPTYVRVECSCGWKLFDDYLRDVGERELRNLIDAHIAGGQVGPTMKKVVKMRPAILCYNCERMPEVRSTDMERLLFVCCDGELLMKPRRRLVIEDIGD